MATLKDLMKWGLGKSDAEELLLINELYGELCVDEATKEDIESLIRRKEEKRTVMKFFLDIKYFTYLQYLSSQYLNENCRRKGKGVLIDNGCGNDGRPILLKKMANRKSDYIYKHGDIRKQIEIKYIKERGSRVGFKKNSDLLNVKNKDYEVILFGFRNSFFVHIKNAGMQYIQRHIKLRPRKDWNNKLARTLYLPYNEELFEQDEYSKHYNEMKKRKILIEIPLCSDIMDFLRLKNANMFNKNGFIEDQIKTMKMFRMAHLKRKEK
jgi:hypothetical protein